MTNLEKDIINFASQLDGKIKITDEEIIVSFFEKTNAEDFLDELCSVHKDVKYGVPEWDTFSFNLTK